LQRREKQRKTDPLFFAKGLKYPTVMPLRISPAASRGTDYPRSANVYLIFSRILFVNVETNQHFFRAAFNEDCRLCEQQVWATSNIVGHCSGVDEDIVLRDVPMPGVMLQTADFFETSVHFYQRMWHHIPYRGIESRWHKIFHTVQTGPEVHPPSCTMVTGSLWVV